MTRYLAIGWVGLALLLNGCVDRDGFGLGQNTDDDDNDATGDDDSADDDTEEPPGPWDYYELEAWFDATGGPDGGDANVYLTQFYYEDSGEGLCGRTFTFRADYTYGRDQGDDLFGYADEVITFTSGDDTGTDCPDDYDVGANALMDIWEWQIHPMLFVSCDSVVDDPELGETPITLEPFIWQEEITDGTFYDFCELIGPAASYFFHTGPHEAIWLVPGAPGDLEQYEDVAFDYFAPPDTTNVASWMFYGFSVATDDNKNEPTEGLEGTYEIVPLWFWIIEKEGGES